VTSGLLVAARDPATFRALRDAFGEGRVRKEYLALVQGVAGAGECDLPIAHSAGKVRVADAPGALPAHTEWTPVERRGADTLVRCVARTGRMHQIRAHLAHAGHPLVGDTLYGAAMSGAIIYLRAVLLACPEPKLSLSLT
jgi:23S rRNA pseudouridine1911/1915/1917 synthase